MARNSLAEMADQGAANIAAAQTRKVEVSLANKAIHAYGGEDAVIEYIASGGTISALCKVLGIWNTTFDRWVERGGAARMAAYARARVRAGHSLAEQTIDIADAATIQEVQLAKLRCDRRAWLASKLSEEFSDKKQPLVNIDLGSMALDALRKRSIVNTND